MQAKEFSPAPVGNDKNIAETKNCGVILFMEQLPHDHRQQGSCLARVKILAMSNVK